MNEELKATRKALLDLHRTLLFAQKRDREEITGQTMSPGEMLQAAVDDLHFSWLRQMSELIVALDEARSDEDDPAAAVDAVLAKVRTMVTEPDQAHGFGARYVQVLQKHPEVVAAHRALVDSFAG